MTTFTNSIGTKSTIEFEHSWREGYIVLKMYEEKTGARGNCWEIPEAAFKQIIENAKKILGE